LFGQWYYNTTTQLLYFWYNGTGAPFDKNQYVVTSDVKVLFNVSGTLDAPVENVSFVNLGYRTTFPATMPPLHVRLSL
jgi:hypothetical protein